MSEKTNLPTPNPYAFVGIARKKIVNIEYISSLISEIHGIPVQRIKEKTRKQEVILARFHIMYLCRSHYNMVLKSIGLYLGGKDHSSVIHGCNTFTNLLESDNLAKEYYKISTTELGIDFRKKFIEKIRTATIADVANQRGVFERKEVGKLISDRKKRQFSIRSNITQIERIVSESSRYINEGSKVYELCKILGFSKDIRKELDGVIYSSVEKIGLEIKNKSKSQTLVK